MTNALDVVQIPGYPGAWARRCVVDAWIAAGRPPINSAGRTYEEQKRLYQLWQQGKGNAADNPDANTRQPHVRGMALDLGRWDLATLTRLKAAGFIRPITVRPGSPWPDGIGGFSQNEPWHNELKAYVANIRSIPKVTAAQARNAIPYTAPAGGNEKPVPPLPRKKRKNMTAGVIYTKSTTDQKRRGAIIDTESGLWSPFGWFPVSYADDLGRALGGDGGAEVTDAHYDAIKSNMAALAAANGKVFVDINDADVPKIG